uniref:Uncharacterized protein n=1 Tax=Candidatus Kentrum sp. TUN TaxID=2126343 RepID=A0A450ZG43_9GAMM|nr:MAG: hypothetical protein BECKTUN1418F_GA0071002_101227 [Candidatus Kentron sp. TUN]
MLALRAEAERGLALSHAWVLSGALFFRYIENSTNQGREENASLDRECLQYSSEASPQTFDTCSISTTLLKFHSFTKPSGK